MTAAVAARPARGRVAVLLALAALASSSPAEGVFSDAGSAANTIATATLEPPTNPAAAAGTCTLLQDSIVVSWTRTASTWASGYEVLRSTTNGGPYTLLATVTGQSTESYTDGALPLNGTTYYYVVRATKSSWRSTQTTQVSRTTRTLCT